MSSYRYIQNSSLLSGGVMTGTTVLISKALDLRTLKFAALYASWTGTPNGTFSVQGSLDGVNFQDMGIAVNAAVGSAGSRLIDLGGTGVSFVLLQYTNTSSTGTLAVTGSAKS